MIAVTRLSYHTHIKSLVRQGLFAPRAYTLRKTEKYFTGPRSTCPKYKTVNERKENTEHNPEMWALLIDQDQSTTDFLKHD
jgi:hypothetical protein